MIKSLKQTISGYSMPLYLSEILSKHYCNCFLRMSIIYKNNSYMFTYDTEMFERLEIRKLNTSQKLSLISTLFEINLDNENHLVMADTYLLEPELIYSLGNSVVKNRIKILFYPDFKKMNFEDKIALLIDKITNSRNAKEVEVMTMAKELIGRGDTARTLRYLNKAEIRSSEQIIE